MDNYDDLDILDSIGTITLSTRAAVAVELAENYLLGRTLFNGVKPKPSNGR